MVEIYPMHHREFHKIGSCCANERPNKPDRCPNGVAQWVTSFGVPRSIQSARGLMFESEGLDAICCFLRIQKRQKTHFLPESELNTERFNRTLNYTRAKITNHNPLDWVLYCLQSLWHIIRVFIPPRDRLHLDQTITDRRMPVKPYLRGGHSCETRIRVFTCLSSKTPRYG